MCPSSKAAKFFLQSFVLGPLETNCYLVADPVTRQACLIDPGAADKALRRSIEKNGFDLKFIINTHGHGDHIAANGHFAKPIYIHRLDKDFLRDPDKNMSRIFIFSITSPAASRMLEDGDEIELGNIKFKVLHTPGHTPGSISLATEGAVFTGDALFRHGVGRTDFAYGDERKLMDSIRQKLFTLSDDTIVYPGHGEQSTIGEEKRENPFFN